MNKFVTCLISAMLWPLVTANAADLPVGEFRESATVVDIAGSEWAKNFAGVINRNELVGWRAYVPKDYQPDVPAGLVVYISPSNSGEMPSAWQSVMDDKNLIWIAADRSGNRIDPRIRVAYSLLAPMFIGKKYNLDPNRMYVAGLSGGGRVASIVAPEYGIVFDGAIYICGVNKLPELTQQKMEFVQSGRYVFLTGSQDFNRRETKQIYNRYRRSGIENSLYLEIRNMGHENPDAEGFSQAIAYLDGDETR